MLNIKIRRKGTGELVNLTSSPGDSLTLGVAGGVSGSLSMYTDDSGKIKIAGTTLPYDEWYNIFLSCKREALWFGGSVEGQSFSEGIYKSFVAPKETPYLCKVNDCTPATGGKLFVIGDKNISATWDIDENKEHTLCLSTTKTHSKLRAELQEINSFLWVLYHAINYQMRRLHVFDIKTPYIDKNFTKIFGLCFGTYVEYQAQVARWNHYVWLSSALFSVDVVNEKVMVLAGYTASACYVKNVHINIVYEIDGATIEEIKDSTDKKAKQMRDAIAALTVFRNGVTSTLGKFAYTDDPSTGEVAQIPVSINKYYVDLSGGSGGSGGMRKIYGNGYEAPTTTTGPDGETSVVDPKLWYKTVVDFDIPCIYKNESYAEVFALAVGVGAVKNMMLPDKESDAVKLPLTVTTTWTITYADDSTEIYSRSRNVAPVLANVIAEDGEES